MTDDAPSTPAQPPPSRRPHRAAVAVVVVLTAATSLAAWQRPTGTDPASGVACIRSTYVDEKYCDRFMADQTKRRPLGDADRRALTTSANNANNALKADANNRCLRPDTPCANRSNPAMNQESEAAAIQATLCQRRLRQRHRPPGYH